MKHTRRPMFILAGLVGLAMLALQAPPAAAMSCTCSGGIDKNGASIPPSSTYCGYLTCGLGNVQWECGLNGWRQTGVTCGSAACACSGGQDEWAGQIASAATYCGFQTCGRSLERWQCGTAGAWSKITPNCTFRENCRCYDGRDASNNPIPPGNTYCGYTVCGLNNAKFQCTQGGWQNIGTCTGAVGNAKFGINTADWLWSAAGENASQNTAQSYRMGHYLMMIGRPGSSDWTDVDFRIAPALNDSLNRGLTPILRLCSGTNCTYGNSTGAGNLVSLVNNASLHSLVTRDWWMVLGPNEPPSERWMTTTSQNLPVDCGDRFCSSSVQTIANDMAWWVDYVLDRVNSSVRKRNGGRLSFMSPVFDCHHPNTQELMTKFRTALAGYGRGFGDFDAIGINAYNLHGSQATSYIASCKAMLTNAGVNANAFSYFLTETGMLEVQEDGQAPAKARDNFRDLNASLRGDGSIRAVLFFNATGRNTAPEFQYNKLTDDAEWRYITGGW